MLRHCILHLHPKISRWFCANPMTGPSPKRGSGGYVNGRAKVSDWLFETLSTSTSNFIEAWKGWQVDKQKLYQTILSAFYNIELVVRKCRLLTWTRFKPGTMFFTSFIKATFLESSNFVSFTVKLIFSCLASGTSASSLYKQKQDIRQHKSRQSHQFSDLSTHRPSQVSFYHHIHNHVPKAMHVMLLGKLLPNTHNKLSP